MTTVGKLHVVMSASISSNVCFSADGVDAPSSSLFDDGPIRLHVDRRSERI